MRGYLLGSGYCGSDRCYPTIMADSWIHNVLNRSGEEQAKEVVVIAVDGWEFPWRHRSIQTLSFKGNLGHVHDLISGKKKNHLCGWSASILTLAMMAYTAELDFVYQEADCLAFGPVIGQMREEMGKCDVIFGSYKNMPCAQSLFMVRRNYIPLFVRDYLSRGADEKERDDGRANLPEDKFHALEVEYPNNYTRFSFGYDRDRPAEGLANCKDECWYVQQLTKDELRELASVGRIPSIV